MNKDTQTCYEILSDYVYNGDSLVFELALNKISDRDLKIGLLFEIYLKADQYEADKEKLLKVIPTQIEKDDMNLIDSYHKHFVDEMKIFWDERKKTETTPPLKTLEECISFLEFVKDYPEDIKWSESPEIVDRIKKLDKKGFEYLKSLLIEQESYEEVVELEKSLNLSNI